jgi:hypothetical protein
VANQERRIQWLLNPPMPTCLLRGLQIRSNHASYVLAISLDYYVHLLRIHVHLLYTIHKINKIQDPPLSPLDIRIPILTLNSVPQLTVMVGTDKCDK